MNLSEIRRINLNKIITEKYGNLNKFCTQFNMQQASLYRALNGERNFGENLARKIEIAIELEPYSLDKQDSPQFPKFEFAQIRQFAVKACAGSGNYVITEEELEPVYIPMQALKAKGYKANDVCCIKVNGLSMSPTFEHDDWIFIHKKTEAIINYKSYLIRYDDMLMIKRLEKIGSTITMRSDNSDKNKYPDIIVREGIQFEIIGLIFFKMGITE